MPGLEFSEKNQIVEQARELSWKNFGKKITFYLPGMIRYGDEQGKYPAISVTGGDCELDCDHCQGKVLEPMIPCRTSELLRENCLRLAEQGFIGCLLSGGSNGNGVVPWDDFVDVIREIKQRTNLKISIHTGIINRRTARKLKQAGVDQALIDVIGSDDTVREICHLKGGIKVIRNSLRALSKAGIPTVPHIVVGLHNGEIRGEFKALEIIREYQPETVVIVTLTNFNGTPMSKVTPPSPEGIAEVLLAARLTMPETEISLGCERSRGKDGWKLEEYAVDIGVNRIAIQSDKAIKRARDYGLEINFQKTCCSVNY
ncbi:MAG: radical SAM protein, partial [Deltaproteobacteria bacterium]